VIIQLGSDFTISQDLGVNLEEGTKFFRAFMDAYPGLEKNFADTKKLALQRGWIELDPFTKKRYFFPHYKEMLALHKRASAYYPENYNTYTKEEKAIFKADLKIKSPELSGIWKQYMIFKGKLERASLNYRIQSNASTMMKIAAIMIEKNNNSLEEGLLLIVHDETVETYLIEKTKDKSKFTVECMKNAGKVTCKKVPMDAVSEIGDYWIH